MKVPVKKSTQSGTRTKTHRKRSGDDLLKTNRTLDALIRYSPLAIVLTDVDSNVLVWNAAAERIFGWTEAEVLGRKNPIVPNDKQEEYLALQEKVRRGNNYSSKELRRRKKDGSAIYLNAASASLCDDNGSVAGLFAIFEDITARRQRAEALQESEERFRSAFENASVGASMIDLKGRFVKVNKRLCDILGYSEKELLSRTFSDVTYPTDVKVGMDALSELIAGKAEHLSIEKRYIRKDGRVIHGIVSPSVIRDKNGDSTHCMGLWQDITERKQAVEALKAAVLRANEEKAKSEAVISAIGDEMVILDPGFNIIYQNKFAINYMGDHVGKICYQAYENRDAVCEGCPVALSFKDGLIHRGERFAESIRGTLHLDITASPLLDASGNVTAVIEMVKDISERTRAEEELRRHRGQLMVLVEERTEELKKTNEKLMREIVERERMEAELIRAQKLESLGVLAGGIAHDFNNLLTTTLGNISLALLDLDPKHPAYRQLAAADRAMQRAQGLTQQLLTFSRGGAPVKSTLRLGDLIEEAAGFALRGSRVRYELALPDDLWLVDADAGQLSQVFHNLVLNADQAMPNGGAITLACENVVLSNGDEPLLSPGRYVKVTVRDSGIGIPKEHLSKIFDPYFTTKQRGSGLGLATTYSIVRKHGGHISATSTPGLGTTFAILLPASSQAAAASTTEAGSLKRGNGKILLMDDEDDVRQTTGEALMRLGYSVVFAEDGSRAIELYQEAVQAGEPFDAVIVDLTVPGGMGGKETVTHLLRIDPGVKAIVSSGYSNDPVMADYRTHGFAGFVSKPYRLKQLSDMVFLVIAENAKGPSRSDGEA